MAYKPDKIIIIDEMTVGRGTSVKIEDNTNLSTEDTFDGPVSNGMEKTSYSVEIGKLIAANVEDYMQLRHILKDMKVNKKSVTIKERVRTDNGTYTIKQDFKNCLVDSYSKELSVDSLTTETIKFTAEDMEEDATRD